MFGKHRLQKPTRFVALPTKWTVSPKTDEIIGNSGTATAVPSVPGAGPLIWSLHFPKCENNCTRGIDSLQSFHVVLSNLTSVLGTVYESLFHLPQVFPVE